MTDYRSCHIARVRDAVPSTPKISRLPDPGLQGVSAAKQSIADEDLLWVQGPSNAIVAAPALGRPANGTLFTAVQNTLSAAAQNSTWVTADFNYIVSSNINRLTVFNTGLRGFFERDTLAALQGKRHTSAATSSSSRTV